MKTYLIDWGQDADAPRFALLQTRDLDRALLELDADIGEPETVTELKLPYNPDTGLRYAEFAPFEGPSVFVDAPPASPE